MENAISRVPEPYNEPVRPYAPGDPERASLKAALARIAGETIEIPCIIGGERVKTGRLESVVMPHDHGHVLANFHCAGPEEVERAARAAMAAKREWEDMPWEARTAVILRAAELLATKWRDTVNAATMLGQSKTANQAEIDAACELIDFWRFNASYAAELYTDQPRSVPGCWNRMELRPIEGFVFALTPFNFTAIGGNLPTAPALLGNTAIWKPAETQTLSAYYTFLLLEEAGIPPGVINFLPGFGQDIAPAAIDHPDFGGLHYTGSTAVFKELWRRTSENLDRYKSYPRIVGETGGKDFIVAHPSAPIEALPTAIVRGAFEFQGQKCSAASRAYIAKSVWDQIRDEVIETTSAIRMGDPRDFRNFMCAVIKKQAFDRHAGAIERARAARGVEILAGGECDDSKGYFVRPTIIQTEDPGYETMKEELFGPIITIHVYPDSRYSDILEIVDQTSPYALTGGVFANDRRAVNEALTALRHSAGNFYVNDKPTGSIVSQQPFGGARASGTNDKAGSPLNLLRWASARAIKETYVPPTDYRYPYMSEE
jgi:1-pyrroline-5-carboxylate dehydrogenase